MFSHPHLIFRFGFPINSQSIGFLANKFKFNKSESWKVVNKEKSFFIFAAATVRARRKWSYKASAKSSAKLNQTRGSSNICFFLLGPDFALPPSPSILHACVLSIWDQAIKLRSPRLILRSYITFLRVRHFHQRTDGRSFITSCGGIFFIDSLNDENAFLRWKDEKKRVYWFWSKIFIYDDGVWRGKASFFMERASISCILKPLRKHHKETP